MRQEEEKGRYKKIKFLDTFKGKRGGREITEGGREREEKLGNVWGTEKKHLTLGDTSEG